MAARLAWALALAFALSAPFWMSGYHLYQFAQVLIYAIALLGLNLLTGYNGQLSLGHGAFFAIGGYGAAVLIVKFGWPYYAAIPTASAVCFVAGFLFGFPALRFGGLYLALATFALAVATPQLLAYKRLDFITGGSQGVQTPKPGPLLGSADDHRSERVPALPRGCGRAVPGRRTISSAAGWGARWSPSATSPSPPRAWA